MFLYESEDIYDVMIYTSWADPKGFRQEDLVRIKIQIDNLIRIGWKKDNIILATNFDFYYRGVESIMIPDSVIEFKQNRRRAMFAAKPAALKFLLKTLPEGKSIFFHDPDAYQNIDNLHIPCEFYNYDMCLTSYNYDPLKINTGVWYLKPTETTYEILDDIIESQREHRMCRDEPRLTEIVASKKYEDKICVLGSEWNFGKHNPSETFARLGYRKPYFCHFKEHKLLNYFRPYLNKGLLKIISCHLDSTEITPKPLDNSLKV